MNETTTLPAGLDGVHRAGDERDASGQPWPDVRRAHRRTSRPKAARRRSTASAHGDVSSRISIRSREQARDRRRDRARIAAAAKQPAHTASGLQASTALCVGRHPRTAGGAADAVEERFAWEAGKISIGGAAHVTSGRRARARTALCGAAVAVHRVFRAGRVSAGTRVIRPTRTRIIRHARTTGRGQAVAARGFTSPGRARLHSITSDVREARDLAVQRIRLAKAIVQCQACLLNGARPLRRERATYRPVRRNPQALQIRCLSTPSSTTARHSPAEAAPNRRQAQETIRQAPRGADVQRDLQPDEPISQALVHAVSPGREMLAGVRIEVHGVLVFTALTTCPIHDDFDRSRLLNGKKIPPHLVPGSITDALAISASRSGSEAGSLGVATTAGGRGGNDRRPRIDQARKTCCVQAK